MEWEWLNVRDTNGGTFDSILDITFTTGWNVSQAYHVDPIASGEEVPSLGSVANARFSSTVADWATARTYLSHDAANSEVDFLEAVADNVVVLQEDPLEVKNGDEFRYQVKLANISGIDDVEASTPSTSGDAILFGVYDSTDDGAYVMGLEAHRDPNGVVSMYCVGYQWSNASGGYDMDNGIMNAACDGATDIILRFDHDAGRANFDFYYSLDGGQTFVNMLTGGIAHYDTIGGTSIGDLDMEHNDLIFTQEFVSYADAISDNVVSVDEFRVIGMIEPNGAKARDIEVSDLDDFSAGN
jgi:hypothetical protein